MKKKCPEYVIENVRILSDVSGIYLPFDPKNDKNCCPEFVQTKNLKTENVRKDFKQPDKLRTIKFEYRKCPDRFLYNSNNRINSGQLKNSGQISDSLSKKG